MRFNFPKNDKKYYWTQHCARKMLFYGLTADRIKRIIRSSKRVENGVAENTIAVMCPAGSKTKPSEIWVMYQQKSQNFNSKFKIPDSRFIVISAWRYPGVSPVGKEIPIPQDILEELKVEMADL